MLLHSKQTFGDCAVIILFTFRPQIGPSVQIMSYCISWFVQISCIIESFLCALRDKMILVGKQIENVRV